MYQGHKKLRLRSEMCLLKTLIIPFPANPQSCPYNFYLIMMIIIDIKEPQTTRL
jgi:hypothetical protein